MDQRPDRDTYFMTMALVASLRSTCLRTKVGAVIVKDKRILSTGYNGSPRGLPHCSPTTCGPNISHCRATVHAELNAIISAAYHGVSTKHAILYTTLEPCKACCHAIINAGIVNVVYHRRYDGCATGLLHGAKVLVTTVKPLHPMEVHCD